MHLKYLICLIISGFMVKACGRTGNQGNKVDAVFEHMDSKETPGCACSVMKEGELVYANGYGMANLEHNIEITPNSVFHIASVSKHFTAMAIELLVNEGKVSWDDDIRKYVPEVPDFDQTITLDHLVHHVSGIRDQWDLLLMSGWRWEADVVTQKDVLDITSRQKALNFKPGERYLYSNTGFTLLAVVVERVAGQSLRAFCEEMIFKPLGMKNTHFHDNHEMIVPNRAWAYAPDEDGYLGYKGSIPDFDVVGATSLFTTVLDLAKWEKNFYTRQVGGEAAMSRLLHNYILSNGDTLSYMHGLDHSEYRGLTNIGHGGADAGYRSSFMRFVEHDLSISVLCNFPSSNPWNLAQQVAEIYLGSMMQSPAVQNDKGNNEIESSLEESQLAGYYLHPESNDSYTISWKDNHLILGLDPGYRLIKLKDFQYLLEDTQAKMEFTVDSAGLWVTRFLPDGDLHYFRSPWNPTLETLNALKGTYHSRELDTEYHFTVKDSSLTFYHRKIDSARMVPLFDHAFRIDGEGYLSGSTIVFNKSNQSFTISDYRVWNVGFEKLP